VITSSKPISEMSERNKSKVRSIRGMKRIYSDEVKTGSTNILFIGCLGVGYHSLVVEGPFLVLEKMWM
jgi:hypothetical protein